FSPLRGLLTRQPHIYQIVVKRRAAPEVGDFLRSCAVCVASAGYELVPPNRGSRYDTGAGTIRPNSVRKEAATAIEDLDICAFLDVTRLGIGWMNFQRRSNLLFMKHIHKRGIQKVMRRRRD